MSSRLSSFLAILVAVVGLTLSSPALAGGIAYVDFARAADESTEVKAEQERLQKLYAAKLAELQKQSDDLKKAFEDYENRKLIMTEDARAQAEQALLLQRQTLQQNMMRYQQEIDQQIAEAMQKLDGKLRAVSSKIARERGYDLVIDKAIVVYSGAGVVDMTDAVIQAYNAQK